MTVSHGTMPRALLVALAPALLLASNAASAADKARVDRLTDLAFGTLSTSSSDQIASNSLCVYSSSSTNSYRVTITGSGTGGAFVLSSGTDQLPIDVQWAFTAGQTIGTNLTPGVALSGTTANDFDQNCNQTQSASLIAILRATDNGAATAGTYSGSLTVLVAPN